MSRLMACPWQKIIRTEKRTADFNIDKDKDDPLRLSTQIITNVKFGRCKHSCPFYDAIGNYCRRKQS